MAKHEAIGNLFYYWISHKLVFMTDLVQQAEDLQIDDHDSIIISRRLSPNFCCRWHSVLAIEQQYNHNQS